MDWVYLFSSKCFFHSYRFCYTGARSKYYELESLSNQTFSIIGQSHWGSRFSRIWLSCSSESLFQKDCKIVNIKEHTSQIAIMTKWQQLVNVIKLRNTTNSYSEGLGRGLYKREALNFSFVGFTVNSPLLLSMFVLAHSSLWLHSFSLAVF